MNDLEKQDAVRAMRWRDGVLSLIDQRQLPGREVWLPLHTAADVAGAIREMVVRGAPAIGVTAAYGCVIAARDRYAADAHNWRRDIEADLALLTGARPTAVNLHWAVQRMRAALDHCDGDPVPVLQTEAEAIHREDIEANRRMGELGAAWLEGTEAVLTHCNTGSLATGGYGTALGVIRTAWSRGYIRHVYAAETRPWLQGSRLTAWELQQEGIPSTVIADAAAAHLMAGGRVGWVVVGADRITAGGDVANKIGTYLKALPRAITAWDSWWWRPRPPSTAPLSTLRPYPSRNAPPRNCCPCRTGSSHLKARAPTTPCSILPRPIWWMSW